MVAMIIHAFPYPPNLTIRVPEISVPIAARSRGPLKINPTAVARTLVGKSSGNQAATGGVERQTAVPQTEARPRETYILSPSMHDVTLAEHRVRVFVRGLQWNAPTAST